MHRQNPNAKFHHQMEAATQLRKLGIDPALSPFKGEGWDEEGRDGRKFRSS
jgi:hypothetical protein